MITEYSQINSYAPDRLAIPGLDYSMFSKAVNYVERKPVGGPSDGAVPPFYPLVTEFDELLEPETEEDEPIEQYSVMLKEGYVIERSPTGDAIIIHIPAVDLDPMDSDPRPTVSVPVGKAVFVRIQTDDSGEINESVAIVVDDPDKESVHHSVGVDGDYYIKVGEMKLGEDEVPYYKTYVQSDIDHYRESDEAASPEMHPWKLVQIAGNWQVYGGGATIEKRWSGDTHDVTDLDTNLTLGGGVNYIYARATVSSGLLSDFTINVGSAALDRVVSVAGAQTELNVLIGTISGGIATQRLRDPINVTLTCVAGVPAWVPLLSEGVVP